MSQSLFYALQEKKKSHQKENDPQFGYTSIKCDKKKKDINECPKKTGKFLSFCSVDGFCTIFGRRGWTTAL